MEVRTFHGVSESTLSSKMGWMTVLAYTLLMVQYIPTLGLMASMACHTVVLIEVYMWIPLAEVKGHGNSSSY